MTAFEDLKMQGVSTASLTLSGRQDESHLVALIHAWLDQTADVYRGDRSEIAEHRATAKLADTFEAAGLPDAADHLRCFSEVTGPIHPGIWLFAILLGKACAKALVEGLHSQRWHPAVLWGHDCFGAWEAYRDETVRLLSTADKSCEAAWIFADGLISETVADPARHIVLSGNRTSGIVKALKDYSAKPTIEESWETRLGAYIHLEQAFFLRLLGELDRPRCLLALCRLPHPAFVEEVLDVDRSATDPIALVSASPTAFDDQGVFLHQGMVVFSSLRVAAAHIRRLGWEGGDAPILYPTDQSAALEAALRSTETAIDAVLDAIFARADAELVAWAWLERLVFEVEHRGYWRIDRQQGNGTALDVARILIMHIASRLVDRADWQDWILGIKPLWQINRLVAVLAAGLWGKTRSKNFIADCLSWALMECVVEFANADIAIARSDGIVAGIGAACILSNDDSGAFLRSLWHPTRPVREQAWRNTGRNQIAALVAFWGVRALELGDNEARKSLEPVVEDLLRDALQTEPNARQSAFWPRALQRFASTLHLPEASETVDLVRRIADFLRPFVRPDSLFLDLIILISRKQGPEIVHSALASLEIDLATSAQEFLEIEKRRIQSNAYNTKWLEKIRGFAGAA